jgi:microcompartment protein CcmK/EutM
MLLGKVIGTVVATKKTESLTGLTLLLVNAIDPQTKEPTGTKVVAVDSVGAGVGEIVLYASGSSARLTKTTDGKPGDAVIMAIVDSVDIEK